MITSNFINRLKRAVDPRSMHGSVLCTVQRADLAELIRQYEKLNTCIEQYKIWQEKSCICKGE